MMMKVQMRQAAVQWVSGRGQHRHRLLPLGATASHTVFPACRSSLSLSLINHGPQLQRWAVPVASVATDDDDGVRLVALGNRDAALRRHDSERSVASLSNTPVSVARCAFPLLQFTHIFP